MFSKRLISISLLFSQLVYADPIRLLADKSFVPVSNGWYFSDKDESVIRARLVEADYIEKQLALQVLLTKQIKDLAEENANLAEHYHQAFLAENDHLVKVVKSQAFNHWLYLGLGITLTLASGFAIGMVAKGLR